MSASEARRLWGDLLLHRDILAAVRFPPCYEWENQQVTITEFIAARLAEIKAATKAAIRGADGKWHVQHDGCDDECESPCPLAGQCHADQPCWHRVVMGDGICIYDEGGHDQAQAAHIALHDPARTLRDVEAWRAILARHTPVRSSGRTMCATCLGSCTFWPCPDLRDLAAIDSGHRDYDPSWAPNPT